MLKNSKFYPYFKNSPKIQYLTYSSKNLANNTLIYPLFPYMNFKDEHELQNQKIRGHNPCRQKNFFFSYFYNTNTKWSKNRQNLSIYSISIKFHYSSSAIVMEGEVFLEIKSAKGHKTGGKSS